MNKSVDPWSDSVPAGGNPAAQSNKRWGMVINLDRCVGCWTCAVACKLANNQPMGTWWNRILTIGGDHIDTPAGTYPDVQKYYEPVSCQHCENAPCVRVCPVGATYQRADGLVLIDYDKCIGCRYCIAACPYGVRVFNWQRPDYSSTEGQPFGAKEVGARPPGVTEKCTFCVHRLDQGKDPVCVEACPVQARMFGDLNDPNSQVAQVVRDGDAFRLREDLGTRPNVYYLPAKKATRQRRGGYADLLTKAKLSTR